MAQGSFDKNKVMNVRPLRCLVPIFSTPPGISSSSSPQTAPFVCAPPTGPFPPGFNSFYPFHFPQNAIPAPVPLSSFRTPPAGPKNGNSGPSRRKTRSIILDEDGNIINQNSSKKRGKRLKPGDRESDADVEAIATNFLSSFDLSVFNSARNSESDKELVRYVLLIMNFLRRKIAQIEGCKEATQRPDLRAATILMNKGIRVNTVKRVGSVPGVEIGDIFYFRMELCLVGMHAPSMAGIDYMFVKNNNETDEPVAVSIVSSGGYEDNDEDADVIIYSGQGGSINKGNECIDVADQKLERGNLALEKSLHRGNEVRVIRGLKDVATHSGKIYLYDGLYKIQESWIEKGKSGFNIFKYKFVRIPGQPQGFALWKAIQEGVTSRPGLILKDISSSEESIPVSLINEVDDEKGPDYFTYFPGLKYTRPVNLSGASRCSCMSTCQAGDGNCPCVQKNEGKLLYNALGVLMKFKSIIHECGLSCSCPATCRNRVTQGGLKVRLEVFKTRDKGWGLRSLDPIRSGAFICEYAGEVIDKSTETDDNFVFDATRVFEPREIMINGEDESSRMPFPLVISAANIGNVARFMNHSCSPNVYWQPLLREKNNESYLHIMFFAINNIGPMRELTFDYGLIRSGDAELRKKKCLCGSLSCRGYFY